MGRIQNARPDYPTEAAKLADERDQPLPNIVVGVQAITFTTTEVKLAIKETKMSIALSPYNEALIMLKKLGNNRIQFVASHPSLKLNGRSHV